MVVEGLWMKNKVPKPGAGVLALAPSPDTQGESQAEGGGWEAPEPGCAQAQGEGWVSDTSKERPVWVTLGDRDGGESREHGGQRKDQGTVGMLVCCDVGHTGWGQGVLGAPRQAVFLLWVLCAAVGNGTVIPRLLVGWSGKGLQATFLGDGLSRQPGVSGPTHSFQGSVLAFGTLSQHSALLRTEPSAR